MLRRRDADRDFIRDIDRSATVTIDKNRVSDIPISDLDLVGVNYSPIPMPPYTRVSYPPPRFFKLPERIITTGGGGAFKKVIPPVTDGVGVGDVGEVSLEERGKKISIYIIIGAVIIVGFLAMRRK